MRSYYQVFLRELEKAAALRQSPMSSPAKAFTGLSGQIPSVKKTKKRTPREESRPDFWAPPSK